MVDVLLDANSRKERNCSGWRGVHRILFIVLLIVCKTLATTTRRRNEQKDGIKKHWPVTIVTAHIGKGNSLFSPSVPMQMCEYVKSLTSVKKTKKEMKQCALFCFLLSETVVCSCFPPFFAKSKRALLWTWRAEWSSRCCNVIQSWLYCTDIFV